MRVLTNCLGAFALVTLTGCSHGMVTFEKAMDAGSAAWDQHVDAVIESCRAQQLPTESERAACVAEVRELDTQAVAPGVTATVAALRAYWIAKAAGAGPLELARLARQVYQAAAGLPLESFGGIGGRR